VDEARCSKKAARPVLEGQRSAERAELIEWLLEQGITVEEIQASPVPMPGGVLAG